MFTKVPTSVKFINDILRAIIDLKINVFVVIVIIKREMHQHNSILNLLTVKTTIRTKQKF